MFVKIFAFGIKKLYLCMSKNNYMSNLLIFST